jgi:endoglucanase
LGLIVKHIEEKGFLRFATVGGWDIRNLPARRVKVHGKKGPIVGVVGTRPPHLMEPEEMKIPVKLKDMFIDIGASSDKEVKKAGVSVGDQITRHAGFDKMVGKRAVGPGFDNRAGCTVLVEAMKKLKKFKGTVYAVGTVQEEVGLIGVRGATFGINPDVVLALDTSIGGDTPEIKPSEASLILGKGPVLGIKDAITFINPVVRKWLQETADKMKISLQYEVTSGGASDASVVPMIREGIPSGGLYVAVRNIHSSSEVVDLSDIQKAVDLVATSIQNAHKYF